MKKLIIFTTVIIFGGMGVMLAKQQAEKPKEPEPNSRFEVIDKFKFLDSDRYDTELIKDKVSGACFFLLWRSAGSAGGPALAGIECPKDS